ncbi:MAG: hypothetical protein AB7F86_03065 [Bdellovibrionales bacterium]
MRIILFIATLLIAQMASARDCTAPWGGYVSDGFSVQAFRDYRPPVGVRCQSEYRYCRDGWLSGSYQYQNCYEDLGCQTWEFGYISNGSSVTAYRNSIETGGMRCQSEIRTCWYGQLSGSYMNRSCQEYP